ncbi:hypothetical protein ATERTT37_006622 [Aspergillus terreus]
MPNVPKPANKIHAVAVARLYVAYPDPHKWTYTGIQGAAVLANDLVGRTFWLKIVDISPSGRGVIWDQEIYDNFPYNQDRTFFHTFELEDCAAGLSFADEKEAKTFIKKVHEREKNASKETRQTPFASTRGQGPAPVANGKHGIGRSIFGSLLGHRSSSGSSAPPPTQHAELPAAPALPVAPPPPASPARKSLPFDTNDPSWKGLLDELLQMGITEDQIAENSDFIKAYIEQKQANGGDSSPASEEQNRGKAPPPPPPSAPPTPKTSAISPQNTGNTPPLPKPAGGRDDLMAAIRASGGAGAGGLRKVRDTEKRDRSAAMVPGGANESSAPTPSSGGGPQGGLAGALQDALAKRKQKVSGSDDEKDDDDDW